MIKIDRTITIHRSVEEVFTYLSDVGHGPQYISGQREAHRTSAGPMGIGATFATEYEPNHRFAWKANIWLARDDNVGFRAVRPQHQSHVHAGGRRYWPAEASGAGDGGAREQAGR